MLWLSTMKLIQYTAYVLLELCSYFVLLLAGSPAIWVLEQRNWKACLAHLADLEDHSYGVA